MAFKRNIAVNYLLFDVAVDNLYISEYMPEAPGDFVKAYLSALMRVNYGLSSENTDIAKALSLPLSTITDAWEYWEAQGLLRKSERPSGKGFDYEFVSLRDEVFGSGSSFSEGESETKTFSSDESLRRLYLDIETVTGRILESGEPEAVASWISEYGMEPEFILEGYGFCVNRRKSNRRRYVEAVLKGWLDNGLKTAEDVREYLEGNDRQRGVYKRIFRELGFNRNPSEPEKRIIDSWFDSMGFSLEEVLKACAKTTGITNPNINYINAVLRGKYDEKHRNTDMPGPASIDALYAEIREKNKKKTEEKRKKIISEIPSLEEVLSNLRAAGMKLTGLTVAGAGKSAVQSVRKRIEDLTKEKENLLAQGGYPPDALDMIYSCKECKDTGILEDGTSCRCYFEKQKQLAGQARPPRPKGRYDASF